ncbi:MAG: hypothetical protein ACI835_003779 [Planctomycetota bacterium]|jgi:hypothetical protein
MSLRVSTHRLAVVAATLTATLTVATAQWTLDSLAEPRFDMASGTAGDMVFFAGANNHADTILLYSPQTRQWSVSFMSEGRNCPNNSICTDASTLIVGGFLANGSCSDRADIYDVSSQAWSSFALSHPRCFVAMAEAGNEILIAGGNSGQRSPVVDIYNQTTQAWRTDSLSVSRRGIAAAGVGQFAVFAGGYVGNTAVDTVDIYDSVSGSWSTASLSQPAAVLTSTSSDQRAYFVSGRDSTGGYSDIVDIFDAATQSWSRSRLSSATRVPSLVALDGKVYFIGGGSIVDVLDEQTNTWTQFQLTSNAASKCSAIVGDKILISSLQEPVPPHGLPQYFSTVEIIDTSTQLLLKSELSLLRGQVDAASVNGVAVFAGGIVPGVGLSDHVDIYEELGTEFCPATANSTGRPAELFAFGSRSISDNAIEMHAGPIPDSPAAFFYGPNQSQVPFGNGVLCVGSPRYRLGDPTRAHDLVAGVRVPSSLLSAIPGPLNFQCLYRDLAAGGSGFNASTAYRIEFVP